MTQTHAESLSPARVWVTGAQGMLGQAVVLALQAKNLGVLATGRELDISRRDDLMAFADTHRPTHLINCAAYTQVDACETQRDEAMRINAEGPGHLGATAQAFGITAAHVSTDYVFDGQSKAPMRESDATAPKSVYGASKLEGEHGFLAEQLRDEAQAPRYVVRTSWLFGPGGNNFVATMMRLMASRPYVEVVDDQVGRPTITGDLAQALVDLIGLGSQAAAASGIYHFANAEALSWHGLAQATFDAMKANDVPMACQEVRKTTSAQFVRPAPRPAYSVFDTSKIEAALGYAPQSFRIPLKAYVAATATENR